MVTPCCWKARLITPSVVSERLKVNGSVARQAIRHLEDPTKGWGRCISAIFFLCSLFFLNCICFLGGDVPLFLNLKHLVSVGTVGNSMRNAYCSRHFESISSTISGQPRKEKGMIAHVGEKPLGLSYLDLVSGISNECSQGFHFKLSCVKQICSTSSNEVVPSVERAVLDTAFARESFAALWLSVVSDYQRSSKQMIYTRKIGGGEDCAVAFTARLFQHSAGSTFPMFRVHI